MGRVCCFVHHCGHLDSRHADFLDNQPIRCPSIDFGSPSPFCFWDHTNFPVSHTAYNHTPSSFFPFLSQACRLAVVAVLLPDPLEREESNSYQSEPVGQLAFYWLWQRRACQLFRILSPRISVEPLSTSGS